MNNELYDNILKLFEPIKNSLFKIAIIVIIGNLIAFGIIIFRKQVKRFLSHKIKTRETTSRPHKY